MAARHPPWFHPARFAHEVLGFTFDQIGWESAGVVHFHQGPEEREAVETIGKAVVAIQAIIRNKLRQVFVRSLRIADGFDDSRINVVYRFMHQGYLECDIFNFLLSNLAVIAELIIFLHEIGIPLPHGSYHVLWCNIYAHRLGPMLQREGGFQRWVEVANRRYVQSGLYRETILSFLNNARIQHAEEPREDDWPDIQLGYLDIIMQHQELPGNTSLAMDALRTLYAHKRGLVPTPEEEQLWLLPF